MRRQGGDWDEPRNPTAVATVSIDGSCFPHICCSFIKCACTAATVDCPEDYLHCSVGGKCIPHQWVCDGHADCRNGTDEVNCMYRVWLKM